METKKGAEDVKDGGWNHTPIPLEQKPGRLSASGPSPWEYLSECRPQRPERPQLKLKGNRDVKDAALDHTPICSKRSSSRHFHQQPATGLTTISPVRPRISPLHQNTTGEPSTVPTFKNCCGYTVAKPLPKTAFLALTPVNWYK